MKEQKRKRGRPRKPRPKKIIWELPEGVRRVARPHREPQSQTHLWLAFGDSRVIGYYKTPDEAAKAVETLNS